MVALKKITGTFEVVPVYTGATSNVAVIFVLARPFFLSSNRDIIRSNKTLFGGREKGAVKTKITGTFEVAPVYTSLFHPFRQQKLEVATRPVAPS